MTIDQKKSLVTFLGNFQDAEWDNLTDYEFDQITDAVIVIMQSIRREDQKNDQ